MAASNMAFMNPHTQLLISAGPLEVAGDRTFAVESSAGELVSAFLGLKRIMH